MARRDGAGTVEDHDDSKTCIDWHGSGARIDVLGSEVAVRFWRQGRGEARPIDVLAANDEAIEVS